MHIWDDCRLWTALRWVVVAEFDGKLFALEQVRLVLGGVIVPRRPSPNVLIGKPAPSSRLRYRQACLSKVQSPQKSDLHRFAGQRGKSYHAELG